MSDWKFLFLFTCNVFVPTCKLQIFCSYLYFTINFLCTIHSIFVSHLALHTQYYTIDASARSWFMVKEFWIANSIPLTHRNRDFVSIMLFQRENGTLGGHVPTGTEEYRTKLSVQSVF